MKIAPYYQKLLEKALQAAKSFEPITYVGMFDSGVDYLFTLLVPLLAAESEKDTLSVAVDLSGLTTKEEVAAEVGFAWSEIDPGVPSACDFAQLTRYIRNFAKKKRIILVLYLGQEGGTANELFLFLNRLRNLLGWRFSYIVFTTTRLLLHPDYARPLFDKVLKRNLVTVQPLDEENSNVVLVNYEERYTKVLPPVFRRQVLELAGGNPGLIKALYLQAIADKKWVKPDLWEEQLYFRLQGITNDLTDQAKSLLLGKRLSKIDPFLVYHLECYGYGIRKAGKLIPFTLLLVDFIKNYATRSPKKIQDPAMSVDTMILNFTKSQRNILEYLQVYPGELISKDRLAQVLWGEQWADRYSDWAIDQLLSTLREKLARLKLPGKIMTKKGEGIIFVPSHTKNRDL